MFGLGLIDWNRPDSYTCVRCKGKEEANKFFEIAKKHGFTPWVIEDEEIKFESELGLHFFVLDKDRTIVRLSMYEVDAEVYEVISFSEFFKYEDTNKS